MSILNSIHSITPGTVTKAIVIDVGVDKISNPYYDNLIKVRVPEVHGFGKYATGFTTDEVKVTSDKNLPWSEIIPSDLNDTTILKYKAKMYGVGDLVYVQFPDGSTDHIIVIGLCAKYSDSLYNGIDMSELVSSSPTFQQEDNTVDNNIIGTIKNKVASTLIVNKTEYKYIFGNPFAKSSDYEISAGYPNYPSGGLHSGLDLAGPVGTPIYAIGDGVVCHVYKGGGTQGYGNYVTIDHGVIKGIHLYSLYGHFSSVSVNKGDKVKGTQEVAKVSWKLAYKKTVTGEMKKLSSEPKNWKTNFTDYYINKGTERNPEYTSVPSVKQEGTQLGLRGSTGNSTGPHLHLTISNDPELTYNKYAKIHCYDPRKFITFEE